MKYIVEFYKSSNIFSRNRWRWRLKGRNGQIICASSEGFYSKYNALRNLELTKEALITASSDNTLEDAYRNPLKKLK